MRAIACLLFLLLPVLTEAAEPLSAADYARALELIAERGDAEAATELAGRRWRPLDDGGSLACDRSLLETAAAGGIDDGEATALRDLARRIRKDSSGERDAVDHDAFTRLAAEQAEWRPASGGSIAGPLESPGVFEAIADWFSDIAAWFLERIGDFFKWLGDWLFPDGESGGEDSQGGISLGVWLLIAVAVVLCAVLVVGGIRRRRKIDFKTPGAKAPAAWQEAGERPQSEWERLGAELLAAGRRREALRAYYNACLAACFSRGSLVYRRGRTNWEYLALLSRELSWHDAFSDLTRHFDIIWYGHHEAEAGDIDGAQHLVREILQQLGRERAA